MDPTILQSPLSEPLFINFSLGILSVIIVGLLSWVLARVVGLTDVINNQNDQSRNRAHEIENKIVSIQKDVNFLSDNLPDTNKIFSKILDLEYRQARMERAIIRINRYLNSPEADLYVDDESEK